MPVPIVIDGGECQLSAALDVIVDLELEIPILAAAKREVVVNLPGK